jgi:uncharacterized protein YjhX (UPF0386 family)
MREQELLNALAKGGTVTLTISEGRCVVQLRYYPYIMRAGTSVFDAVFQVSSQLMEHSFIPATVRKALVAYDQRTEIRAL